MHLRRREWVCRTRRRLSGRGGRISQQIPPAPPRSVDAGDDLRSHHCETAVRCRGRSGSIPVHDADLVWRAPEAVSLYETPVLLVVAALADGGQDEEGLPPLIAARSPWPLRSIPTATAPTDSLMSQRRLTFGPAVGLWPAYPAPARPRTKRLRRARPAPSPPTSPPATPGAGVHRRPAGVR